MRVNIQEIEATFGPMRNMLRSVRELDKSVQSIINLAPLRASGETMEAQPNLPQGRRYPEILMDSSSAQFDATRGMPAGFASKGPAVQNLALAQDLHSEVRPPQPTVAMRADALKFRDMAHGSEILEANRALFEPISQLSDRPLAVSGPHIGLSRTPMGKHGGSLASGNQTATSGWQDQAESLEHIKSYDFWSTLRDVRNMPKNLLPALSLNETPSSNSSERLTRQSVEGGTSNDRYARSGSHGSQSKEPRIGEFTGIGGPFPDGDDAIGRQIPPYLRQDSVSRVQPDRVSSVNQSLAPSIQKRPEHALTVGQIAASIEVTVLSAAKPPTVSENRPDLLEVMDSVYNDFNQRLEEERVRAARISYDDQDWPYHKD